MATFRTALNAVRRVYRRLANRTADTRTREIVDTLQQVAAFTICSKGTLYEVSESMHRRTYNRGEHLYYQGDPGLGLFIVEQGKIQLTAEGGEDATYDLRQLGPYEVCGTISILGDFPRLETARAVTEAQVLGFFRPDLNNLTKRNPAAGNEIISVLAQHVAAQHVQMVRLMEECVGISTALNTYAKAGEAVAKQMSPR